MSEYGNYASFEYDIQGQVVDVNKHRQDMKGHGDLPYEEQQQQQTDNSFNWMFFSDKPVDNPAGEGSNWIPSTAPGLESPHILQVGHRDSGSTVDPVKSAVDANAAGLKQMGIITESEADVSGEPQPVLNVAGSGI